MAASGQPNIGGMDGLNIPKGNRPVGPGKDGDTGTSAAEIQFAELPDTCLIRIIDNDITPGLQYQYRIKVRMQNPNWAGNFDQKTKTWEKPEKLDLVTRSSDAEVDVIEGSWGVASGVVSVPREFLSPRPPCPIRSRRKAAAR